MKFTKTISKNLKLLMRAKSSAFIVLFGPLIIILLVGIALSKPSVYELSIGYYTPDQNNVLTNSFVTQIENNSFKMIQFDSNMSCIEGVKQGGTHACIVFPKSFEMGNYDSNKVYFYVDYSRTNIVYQIIDSVSKEFKGKSSEISQDLTEVLLSKIIETKSGIDQDILSLINIKSNIDGVKTNIDVIKQDSESLNLSMGTISLSNIFDTGEDIFDDAQSLKSKTLSAVSKGKAAATDLNDSSLYDEFTSIETSANSVYNDTADNLDLLEELIDNATAKVNSVKTQLSIAKTKNNELLVKLDSVKTSLDNVKTTINTLKASLEAHKTNLDNIGITSAEDIVSPIRNEIKPIVSESNQLIFFFPYLLMLVIMFIGIMLSSTLIIMEKSSKSAFRNFTTPTKPEYFVFTTFFTSFIILLLQVIVILGLSFYFLKASIFAGLLPTTIILLLTMALFIMVGMIIGYLSSTQEAATMLSIAIGSVFLLLSNIILPIEKMSYAIQNISRFNPYFASSEALKKSLLFKKTLLESSNEIFLLLTITIVLIILVFVINKLSNIKYLERTPHIKKKGYIYLPEDSYLIIGDLVAKDKHALVNLLKNLSEEDFETYVKKKNEVSYWLGKILHEKRLAWKLRSKNREQMIAILNKNLDKEAKKNAKINSQR
jgi:ABC-type multidrug transport system permease subunit